MDKKRLHANVSPTKPWTCRPDNNGALYEYNCHFSRCNHAATKAYIWGIAVKRSVTAVPEHLRKASLKTNTVRVCVYSREGEGQEEGGGGG